MFRSRWNAYESDVANRHSLHAGPVEHHLNTLFNFAVSYVPAPLEEENILANLPRTLFYSPVHYGLQRNAVLIFHPCQTPHLLSDDALMQTIELAFGSNQTEKLLQLASILCAYLVRDISFDQARLARMLHTLAHVGNQTVANQYGRALHTLLHDNKFEPWLLRTLSHGREALIHSDTGSVVLSSGGYTMGHPDGKTRAIGEWTSLAPLMNAIREPQNQNSLSTGSTSPNP